MLFLMSGTLVVVKKDWHLKLEEGNTMGCPLSKGKESATEVVIIISDANGVVIKDFRRKGKTIKKIVFILPVIVVTNENDEETIVYNPEENVEPKVETIKFEN